MDPQDKKSKDYSILGKAEDRAIAMAKYKREMGINPSYKTEQNAEVSRSAQSMKNPTDRPYDVKTSPVGLKKAKKYEVDSRFEISKKNPVREAKFNRGYVPWLVRAIKDAPKATELKRKAAATYTEPYDVKEPSKTEGSKSAPGKTDKKASDKSRLAPKMTNYQRMQARQLEKEGYAGRSLTRAQAQKMAGAKSGANTTSLMVLFGISKPKTEKKVAAPTKRTGPLKSAFAQISYQGRKK